MFNHDLPDLEPTAQLRLAGFIDQIGEILGNKRRRESFALYALGLLGDSPRKSVEPIAARLCPDPDRVQAMHFQLCNFLGRSSWKDEPIRRFAAKYALEEMTSRSPVEHWIVDDTGMLKQGKKSPGVQRQYTGSAGKITNCQVTTSLTLANASMQLPVDFRLYLPKAWTEDRRRCREAHIPEDIGYAPKWQLALDMLEAAVNAELPRAVVLADADYGNKAAFRDGLDRLELSYIVGIHSNTVVERVRVNGRPTGVQQSVQDIALSLPHKKFRKVTWRQGTKQALSSRCTTIRVMAKHTDGRQPTEQWLLIDWPDGEDKPTKYALSNLPPATTRKQLFRRYQERFRIERSYQDLKGQLGFDHFEGRSFPGWHHHVTVVLCCYAFCVAQHARAFPPSAARTRLSRPFALAA